jgi:hypothetical protein
MSAETIIACSSVLLGGGFLSSIVAALRARPDRDAVVIVPWQRLNDALRDQNNTLRADWQSERTMRVESEGRLLLAEQRIDRLEAQLRAMNIKPVNGDQ